ncbi:MAG TPA: hypothetical protein VGI82_03910 [Chitinophagaceae bacterium]|jgi:hypothetical protein
MLTSRFLHGPKLIVLSLLISCSSNEPEKDSKEIEEQLKHPDDYSERVNNIFDYVRKIGFDIKFEKCSSIYILQPNLCNVCTKNALKTLIDSTKDEEEPTTFILGDKNPEMELFIKKMDVNASVYIDSINLLENYNMAFLKNLKINTCKNKVVSWKFL